MNGTSKPAREYVALVNCLLISFAKGEHTLRWTQTSLFTSYTASTLNEMANKKSHAIPVFTKICVRFVINSYGMKDECKCVSGALRMQFGSRHTSKKAKLMIQNDVLIPTLQNGSESWNEDEKKKK